jgi:hypothetical protein
MHIKKWRISEINLVHTANAICGTKTEHGRLKPMVYMSRFSDLCELLTSLLTDKGDPYTSNVHNGLADRTD